MTKKINLKRINNSLKGKYDVFICSASFESRCKSIPEKLRNKRFKKVLIFENINGCNELKTNADYLVDLFNYSNRISVDLSDSLYIADMLIKSLSSITGKLNVLVDVTTFTHEALMICLKYLSCSKKVNSVTCVYVNAASYCPDVPVNQKWLSEGSKGVHSVLGYPGMLLPSQKTHLVIIVGYEYNRAFNVISTIEPSSITLVYGLDDNTTTDKDKGANQHYKHLLKNMAFEYSSIEEATVPCNNPEQVAKVLDDIYSCHTDKNLIVVPMNNKMTTLGVFISTINNDTVQVCYSEAIVYNEKNYSEPGTDCYIYNIKSI